MESHCRLVAFVSGVMLALGPACQPLSESSGSRAEPDRGDANRVDMERGAADDASAVDLGRGADALHEEDHVPCVVPVVDWVFDDLPFEKPELPAGYSDQITKAQFASRLEQWTVPTRAIQYGFAPGLQSGGELKALWANIDEPVRIAFWVANVLESLEDHRIYFTLLLNYRPPRGATWTRWLDDRGGRFETWTQAGIAFDVAEAAELVDLEIPASEFGEAGVYELDLLVRSGRPGFAPMNTTLRLPIFRGGFQWPTPGCHDVPMKSALQGFERVAASEFRVSSQGVGLVFPRGVSDVEEILAPVPATPGETFEIRGALFNRTSLRPSVAIPTLDGNPVGNAWLFHEEDNGIGMRTVAVRRDFQVVMPEAPGTYDLFIPSWSYATQPPVTPSLDRIPGTSTLSGGNTNLLRFVVE